MITSYLLGCLISLILTLILDTIEFRSGIRKMKHEHQFMLLLLTLLSWVGAAIVAVGITIYIYDTYVEIYNQ